MVHDADGGGVRALAKVDADEPTIDSARVEATPAVRSADYIHSGRTSLVNMASMIVVANAASSVSRNSQRYSCRNFVSPRFFRSRARNSGVMREHAPNSTWMRCQSGS